MLLKNINGAYPEEIKFRKNGKLLTYRAVVEGVFSFPEDLSEKLVKRDKVFRPLTKAELEDVKSKVAVQNEIVTANAVKKAASVAAETENIVNNTKTVEKPKAVKTNPTPEPEKDSQSGDVDYDKKVQTIIRLKDKVKLKDLKEAYTSVSDEVKNNVLTGPRSEKNTFLEGLTPLMGKAGSEEVINKLYALVSSK